MLNPIIKPQQLVTDISDISEKKLFQALSSKKHFFYLDSSDKNSKWSNYAFMGFNPLFFIQVQNNKITKESKSSSIELSGNPFDIIQNSLDQFYTDIKLEFTPFWGGAVGYFGYEASRYLKDIPATYFNSPIADMELGFYTRVIAINKTTQQKWFIQTQYKDFDNEPVNIRSLVEASISEDPALFCSDYTTSVSRETYMERIKIAKDYIYNGDIYQVNLSQRFAVKLKGKPEQLFSRLRQITPAPFSAFLNFKSTKILSTSPERFITSDGLNIQTRPIKGTIARGKNSAEDDLNAHKLWHSEKDRAELVMIVDLLRNDLGRICEYGSVKVPEIFTLEKYANVFHLVSTIEGKIKTGIKPMDIIKATFPGGSITGAPKIRSMQIIKELEDVPRAVYTGCIGYFGFNNVFDTNIAIRTMYTADTNLYFHAGGGIVADSDPAAEYQESLDKARGIQDTLNLLNL